MAYMSNCSCGGRGCGNCGGGDFRYEPATVTDKMDEAGYLQQCHEFTERVRDMLGAGYGIGYQLDDLWRVLEARNQAFLTIVPLRSALKPFADEADRIHPEWEDERRRGYLSPSRELTVGDFRNARAVLAREHFGPRTVSTQPLAEDRGDPAPRSLDPVSTHCDNAAPDLIGESVNCRISAGD